MDSAIHKYLRSKIYRGCRGTIEKFEWKCGACVYSVCLCICLLYELITKWVIISSVVMGYLGIIQPRIIYIRLFALTQGTLAVLR